MDKNIMISIFYEYYKNLLTEKQAEAIEMHYLEDLSLTEIAEIQGVSKQSVSETIKRSEKALFDFESSLGMYERINDLSNLVDSLENNLLNDLDDDQFSKYMEIIYQMRNKLK